VLALPPGRYLDVAWFDQEQVAASYTDAPDALGVDRYELVSMDLRTSTLEPIAVPEPSHECSVIRTRWLARLPENQLGLARRCTFWTEHVSERFTDVVAYDAESATFSEVTRSPLREDVVSFSFLPDMSASLQTYDSSGGMVGRVVWVDETGAVTPLFEEFSRTRDATFSPTGEAFAFLGTEHLPKVDGGLFGWQLAYQEQLAHPWTLYVMETKEAEPQALVEKIRFGRNSRWSPAGLYIAFSGEVQAFDGVWIVHLETGNLYRVWRESVLFDWSPDGKQMVILDATPTHGQVDPEPRLVVLTLSLPE
jgi:dipeptidyl aminopeptidase/acylaminoacyl peptidase